MNVTVDCRVVNVNCAIFLIENNRKYFKGAR